jgi:acetylornithine deacetylase
MRDILGRLVAFDTVSSKPNIALMAYVQGLLESAGIPVTLVPDPAGTKANLYATTGPEGVPGVMLSGHTDVVLQAAARPLKVPLHLALSYDEEIGCMGVRSLIDLLATAPVKPRFCIVGEPTGMQVATGHKGKVALRATCTGREGHSALAPMALNALHLAADFLGAVRRLQAEVAATGLRDGDYDVPYSTLHVGKMSGGVQVNIVPNHAVLDFEIRALAGEDVAALIARLGAEAEALVAPLRHDFPEAAIRIERLWDYPGLGTPSDAEVVNFVKGLTGANGTIKVAFGTEGGLFDQRLGVPTVICGPGSMAQGHKPDEFVTVEQIARCQTMLAALIDRLEAGI